MGLCAAGPLVLVDPEETLYQGCHAENAEAIISSLGGEPVAALQCDLREHFEQQVHVVLENSGHIDPEKIDDYIARDGYQALVKALTEMTPNDVVHQSDGERTERARRRRVSDWAEVEHGRQGGWGRKVRDLQWRRGRPGRIHGSQCAGERSATGAGRHGDCGIRSGSEQGYVYVRAEYPLAVARLTNCLRDARRRGLLGNSICNTPFNFDVEIRLGAGAFVCGEETALIASIEGNAGSRSRGLRIRR